MAQQIPLISKASHTFQTVLDNTLYQFRQRWNSREGSWRLDINSSEGDPILQGLKLLPNQNLTLQYEDSRLPSGDIVLISTDAEILKPTFDNIDSSVKLIYLSREEIDGAI